MKRGFALGWISCALGASAILWQLSQLWMIEPDTSDRLLIILAAGWIGWSLAPQATHQARRSHPALGALMIVCFGLAFLPAWFISLEVGSRPLLLWWQSVALLGVTSGLVLSQYGFPTLNALRFPLLFPFLALPVPTRILNPTQHFLQECTTTVSAVILPMLGIPVQRDGFVLTLESGSLGVVEACSGVRSVTALVAIAVFLAHLRRISFLRGLLLVVLSIPVIILVNILRVVISGLLQENFGTESISGWKHELLGFVMVILGLVLILLLTRLITREPATENAKPMSLAEPSSQVLSRLSPWIVVGLAIIGLGITFMPRLSRRAEQPPNFAEIPVEFDGWTSHDVPPDSDIAQTLSSDRLFQRIYTDRVGHQVVFWGIYWTHRTGVKGYHHPDVCWPNRGYTLLAKRKETLQTPGGRTVPLTYREFARDHERQVVVYWTQEGNRFWTEADEQAALNGLPNAIWQPLQWTANRLAQPQEAGADDRVVILLGSDISTTSETARSRVFEMAARVADELFDRCPWADPNRQD